IFHYNGVDVCADIHALPFADGSVDRIICMELIEHIQNPQAFAHELKRILGPGGTAYVTIPFVYPYHASPTDYTRWTQQGFQNLFSEFVVEEQGVRAGPFSALSALCCYLFAL